MYSSKLTVIALIHFWAPIIGVPQNVAMAVAQNESAFNSEAIGKLGEIGVFQVRPEFVQYSKNELRDVKTNVIVGLYLLREAKNTCMFKKDITWVICYNVGRNRARYIKHPELFPYVRRVRYLIAKNKLKWEM